MADIMMQIGLYQFSVGTAAYETMRRSTGWKWAAQERIGQQEALQYTGKAGDTITLSGVIYPHYRGGIEQINTMRDEADAGRPMLFVDGRGYVHGRWVIEKIEEEGSSHARGGVAKRQRFTIRLRKYSDEP